LCRRRRLTRRRRPRPRRACSPPQSSTCTGSRPSRRWSTVISTHCGTLGSETPQKHWLSCGWSTTRSFTSVRPVSALTVGSSRRRHTRRCPDTSMACRGRRGAGEPRGSGLPSAGVVGGGTLRRPPSHADRASSSSASQTGERACAAPAWRSPSCCATVRSVAGSTAGAHDRTLRPRSGRSAPCATIPRRPEGRGFAVIRRAHQDDVREGSNHQPRPAHQRDDPDPTGPSDRR
jgi:hypothetical protein